MFHVPISRKRFGSVALSTSRAISRILTVVASLGVLAIIVASLVPGEDRPHTGYSGHTEHFVSYALVAGTFGLARTSTRARLSILGLLATLSGFMELAQLFVPGRHSALSDALVSSAGACVGLAAGSIVAMIAFCAYHSDERRGA